MGIMTGKRGLIMGLANDKSIAWGIAKALAEHGAELAFSYQGEQLLKRVQPLAAELGSDVVLPCDVTDNDSLDAVFEFSKTNGAVSISSFTPLGFPTKTNCVAAMWTQVPRISK